ncbi:hypothetical protein R1flu_003671 [Riccia fluitans]|uniref:Uncharacterized protein n=1 Tax=Riccia fluitans TaxID=41844 RepID=A0ABD1Y9M5_9MARC
MTDSVFQEASPSFGRPKRAIIVLGASMDDYHGYPNYLQSASDARFLLVIRSIPDAMFVGRHLPELGDQRASGSSSIGGSNRREHSDGFPRKAVARPKGSSSRKLAEASMTTASSCRERKTKATGKGLQVVWARGQGVVRRSARLWGSLGGPNPIGSALPFGILKSSAPAGKGEIPPWTTNPGMLEATEDSTISSSDSASALSVTRLVIGPCWLSSRHSTWFLVVGPNGLGDSTAHGNHSPVCVKSGVSRTCDAPNPWLASLGHCLGVSLAECSGHYLFYPLIPGFALIASHAPRSFRLPLTACLVCNFVVASLPGSRTRGPTCLSPVFVVSAIGVHVDIGRVHSVFADVSAYRVCPVDVLPQASNSPIISPLPRRHDHAIRLRPLTEINRVNSSDLRSLPPANGLWRKTPPLSRPI